MNTIISDKEIIDTLRSKIRSCAIEIAEHDKEVVRLQEKITAYKNAIRELGGEDKMVRTKYSAPDKTFAQYMLDILSDGRPRTSRQLFNDYQALIPSKKVIFSTFSGRLSTIMDKNGIKKHEIHENPISNRFVYGLENWFNGDKLKEEYLDKIDFEK